MLRISNICSYKTVRHCHLLLFFKVLKEDLWPQLAKYTFFFLRAVFSQYFYKPIFHLAGNVAHATRSENKHSVTWLAAMPFYIFIVKFDKKLSPQVHEFISSRVNEFCPCFVLCGFKWYIKEVKLYSYFNILFNLFYHT